MTHDIYTTVTVQAWGTKFSKTSHGYATRPEGFAQEFNHDVDRAAAQVRKALTALHPPSITEHDVKDLRPSMLADFQKLQAVRIILADKDYGRTQKLALIKQVIGGVE